MIEARRTSAWRGDYEVWTDDRSVASFARSSWRSGGVLTVDGRSYEVRSNPWATSYTMVDETGDLVASAARVGRKEWSVEAGGTTYRFRRPSLWRSEEQLHVGGQPTGTIRRTSMWRGDAVADLPGLPPLVALFALAVVLTTWDLAAAAS